MEYPSAISSEHRGAICLENLWGQRLSEISMQITSKAEWNFYANHIKGEITCIFHGYGLLPCYCTLLLIDYRIYKLYLWYKTAKACMVHQMFKQLTPIPGANPSGTFYGCWIDVWKLKSWKIFYHFLVKSSSTVLALVIFNAGLVDVHSSGKFLSIIFVFCTTSVVQNTKLILRNCWQWDVCLLM